MLNDRRCGKFEIAVEVINDVPEVVYAIMAQTIIIRAEAMLASDVIDYTAISEHFEEVPAGSEVPSYDVIYDAETETITWVKQE
ncbi:hypothetical protein JYP52_21275 [Nitratireductor aquibiodomus]|uniref:hypothetical protein n=1 Tax=Nitratireductor TaxID=245876 RepID=UPI000DDE257D|nr:MULTISPECIES: hypothetical protein [Nitratireductor]MBN7763673.1 hypothetical protein [Nitratireductor aquibiodomus]